MRPKLRFFDGCVTEDTNTFALSMFRSVTVGRPSSATCKSGMSSSGQRKAWRAGGAAKQTGSIEKDGLFERTGMHPRCADYCGSLALSIVRSSTKRIAIGRPATAPDAAGFTIDWRTVAISFAVGFVLAFFVLWHVREIQRRRAASRAA